MQNESPYESETAPAPENPPSTGTPLPDLIPCLETDRDRRIELRRPKAAFAFRLTAVHPLRSPELLISNLQQGIPG